MIARSKEKVLEKNIYIRRDKNEMERKWGKRAKRETEKWKWKIIEYLQQVLSRLFSYIFRAQQDNTPTTEKEWEDKNAIASARQ